jgi:trimeric autotransporter adhesin
VKAVIYVYDIQGKQIKSINLTGREQGTIIIHGSELLPGIYYYSLIADGKVIGTEKMILTD